MNESNSESVSQQDKVSSNESNDNIERNEIESEDEKNDSKQELKKEIIEELEKENIQNNNNFEKIEQNSPEQIEDHESFDLNKNSESLQNAEKNPVEEKEENKPRNIENNILVESNEEKKSNKKKEQNEDKSKEINKLLDELKNKITNIEDGDIKKINKNDSKISIENNKNDEKEYNKNRIQEKNNYTSFNLNSNDRNITPSPFLNNLFKEYNLHYDYLNYVNPLAEKTEKKNDSNTNNSYNYISRNKPLPSYSYRDTIIESNQYLLKENLKKNFIYQDYQNEDKNKIFQVTSGNQNFNLKNEILYKQYPQHNDYRKNIGLYERFGNENIMNKKDDFFIQNQGDNNNKNPMVNTDDRINNLKTISYFKGNINEENNYRTDLNNKDEKKDKEKEVIQSVIKKEIPEEENKKENEKKRNENINDIYERYKELYERMEKKNYFREEKSLRADNIKNFSNKNNYNNYSNNNENKENLKENGNYYGNYMNQFKQEETNNSLKNPNLRNYHTEERHYYKRMKEEDKKNSYKDNYNKNNCFTNKENKKIYEEMKNLDDQCVTKDYPLIYKRNKEKSQSYNTDKRCNSRNNLEISNNYRKRFNEINFSSYDVPTHSVRGSNLNKSLDFIRNKNNYKKIQNTPLITTITSQGKNNNINTNFNKKNISNYNSTDYLEYVPHYMNAAQIRQNDINSDNLSLNKTTFFDYNKRLQNKNYNIIDSKLFVQAPYDQNIIYEKTYNNETFENNNRNIWTNFYKEEERKNSRNIKENNYLQQKNENIINDENYDNSNLNSGYYYNNRRSPNENMVKIINVSPADYFYGTNKMRNNNDNSYLYYNKSKNDYINYIEKVEQYQRAKHQQDYYY